MKIRWYKRMLILVWTAALIYTSGYVIETVGNEGLQGQKKKQEVSTEKVSGDLIIPGGMPIGIYMETDGVMILGTDKIKALDGLFYEPAQHRVKEGDYIVGINEEFITNKKELIKAVEALENEEVILHLRRENEYIDVALKPVKYGIHEYKLGIWVRDNAQGLGTITFLNGKSEFGALGHGIHDTDTNELLQIVGGSLYTTSIQDIKKGENGNPGGMEGIIVYNHYNVLGNITKNTDAGIFGKVDKIEALFQNQTPMETAHKEDIKVGNATMRCSIENDIKDYESHITKIDLSPREINKGIELEITDPELLELTGGIVQGMSGSPIIQNGKLVGAVTHVFVQDATKGYGIFIENMLKNVN